MRFFGRIVILSACLCCVSFFSTLSLWAADKYPLRVGAARVDITPSDLTNLNAWGGSYKGVHDPIFARALLMENDGSSAAIVALDIVEIGDTTPVRRRIQEEIGVPADHILITASHDHSTPRVGEVTPGGMAHGATPESLVYSDTLYEKMIEALKQAKASLQPARFGQGAGWADINVNRDEYTPEGWKMGYNPDGPSDKTVWVLKFETPAGEPIALVFNYAVHSSMAGVSESISGDLAGAAERYVEACYDDHVVALFTMGPAGDQNPRVWGGTMPVWSEEMAFDAMNAQGTMLGAEVVRVAAGIEKMTSSVRISAAERIIPCPTKKAMSENRPATIKPVDVESIDLRLMLILLNQTAITGVSGEVVTNIYRHLKEASPLANTIMVTDVNDRIGYIADDAAYDRIVHAVRGTPIKRGYAEKNIVNGLVEMINEQFQEDF